MYRSPAKVLPLLLLFGAVAAYPCGDKLLVMLRNPRYAQNALRPASLLAYAPPGSLAAALVADTDSRSALQKAGHHLQSVETPTALRRALDSGHYDLVLADVGDANIIEAASPGAFLLPLVTSEPEAVRSAERNYRALIKMPGKNSRLLDSIQKALEEKTKQEHALASK